MEAFFAEWIGALPDVRQVGRVSIRLLLALAAGALIGTQRERSGKAAGLRTHMLVALGTAVFVVAASEWGMQEDAMSRVIQGVATGIGFLGAGTILKLTREQEIKGLTTSAGIWMTAGASAAIGLGQFAAALIGVLLAWIVLSTFIRVENRLATARAQPQDEGGEETESSRE